MGLQIRFPVFVDSNIGTNFALDVIPTLKASDLKRELEEAHVNCFPKLGKIKINGLMVKRKSKLYYLPDSLCIMHAFKGSGALWFVHIEACLVSEVVKPTCSHSDVGLSTELRNCVGSFNVNYNSNYKAENVEVKRTLGPKVVPSSVRPEKSLVSRNQSGCIKGGYGKGNNFGDAISEVVSVSGIIKKYFLDYQEEILDSEVTSSANQDQRKGQSDNYHCSNENIIEKIQFTPKTPTRSLIFPLGEGSRRSCLKNKCSIGAVAKKLLVASNELGCFKRSQKTSAGLYRCKGQNPSPPTYSSLVKSLVFEMSNDDV